jgi:hypothetical protein
MHRILKSSIFSNSVPDPDPYVFKPHGSVSQRYGSGHALVYPYLNVCLFLSLGNPEEKGG